jgi:hypothetical protein
MSRPGGTRDNGHDNGDVARGASVAAAKGAGLVVLAIIIGIVLLNIVDNGSKSSSTPSTHKTTSTTKKTTSTTKKTTSTTKAPVTTARAPALVRVIVLNGGAPTGSAKAMSSTLRSKGYTNQVLYGDWPNAGVTGKVVYCKPGFTQEGLALALAVGPGATSKPFPTTAPPLSANVDCVVTVGK